MQITPSQRIERISSFPLIQSPSFLGYFFVHGPLGDLKRVPGDVCGHSDSIGSFFKDYLFFVQKSTFCQGVSLWLLGKNEKNFEVGIFHSFMFLGISACL